MSDLTQDGDLSGDAEIAILFFQRRRCPDVSRREVALMQTWAAECEDASSAKALSRIVKAVARCA